MSQAEEASRFAARSLDPVKQWKLSPTDRASMDKWKAYAEAKQAMFSYTDTRHAPWTVIKSNDKKRARLEAMRFVLAQFDYPEKDHKLVRRPDPLIVGMAKALHEVDESPDRLFPRL